MKKSVFFTVVLCFIAVFGLISCDEDDVADFTAGFAAVPDDDIPPLLTGNWSTVSAEMMALNFFSSDGELSTIYLNITWDGKYTLTQVGGLFGMESKEISSGSVLVYSGSQIIELYDEFDDPYIRFKYVLTYEQDEHGMIPERTLILKDDYEDTLTLYGGAPPQ